MREARYPLLPEEVLQEARFAVRRVGPVEACRSLQWRVGEGIVPIISLPGDSAGCEHAEAERHHHSRCATCRRGNDIHDGGPGTLRRLRGVTVGHVDVTLYWRRSGRGGNLVRYDDPSRAASLQLQRR